MWSSAVLDVLLVVLLGATLVQALRLERTLGALRRDRGEFERMIAGFDGATRQAEAGLDRLRGAADGAGRQIARHIEQASSLHQDLDFLTARGEKLADRLEMLVRIARGQAGATPAALGPAAFTPAAPTSPLSTPPLPATPAATAPLPPPSSPPPSPPPPSSPPPSPPRGGVPSYPAPAFPPAPRRAQAERDLLRVLQATR